MITSRDNLKIKRMRGLLADGKARRTEKAFVVEGVRLVEEALASDWPIEAAFFNQGLGQRGQNLVDRIAARGIPLEEVTSQVMNSLSDTQTPQGVLAVLPVRTVEPPDAPDFIFILDSVRDPGNLGSMLRTAAAAGVQAVLLPPGSVDPFAPKVLRAGMGAHFRLPVITLPWKQLEAYLTLYNLDLYLAEAGKGEPYTRCDFRRPLALLIGGEAQGVGTDARCLAVHYVHIPMPGGSESLNAAVAASILMFEVVRQRQQS